MAWIALFYLLRPGEYCKSRENSPLLVIKDITLVIGNRKLNTLQDPIEDVQRAMHSLITFDDQKNRERGDIPKLVRHKPSFDASSTYAPKEQIYILPSRKEGDAA